MTLFSFAYNNIKRDFKTYLYHFLSCVFSVLIFFLFSTLANHPALKIVEDSGSIGIILFLANIISMIFSFVLTLYSVGNFLRNRSRQFAILNIIGTSKRQFNRLIFLENIIISAFALSIGIVMGIIFSKLFLMIAQTLIEGLELSFYLPIIALIRTLVMMGGLFLAISLISPIILRKKNVLDLLKKKEIAEKNYFLHSMVALIIILPPTIYFHIIEAYFSFIYILELLSFISIFYFVFYLIFTVYHFVLKKNGNIYKKNNLIKISSFKYKINSNIKTMTGATILFCIILTSFIYIIGAPINADKDTKKVIPYSYMYANWENKSEEYKDKREQIIAKKLEETDNFKKLTVSYSMLKSTVRAERHIILSNTMYNSISDFLKRDKISLSDNEYFLVGVNGKDNPVLFDKVRDILVNHNIDKEKGSDKRVIALSGYFTSITVVSDKEYPEISKLLVKDKIYAFEQKKQKVIKTKDFDKLKNEVGFDQKKETLISYYELYNIENLTRKLISYVGSILCVSFLIGIASILYSRLNSSIDEDVKKYGIMMKMGLKREELDDILASTLRWIFIMPFVTSFAVSLIFVILINSYTLTSYTGLAVICSGIYIFIEVILYILIKRRYQTNIHRKISYD